MGRLKLLGVELAEYAGPQVRRTHAESNRQSTSRRRLAFLILLALSGTYPAAALAADRRQEDLWTERRGLEASFAKQLDALAAWCAETRLSEEEAEVRRWRQPRALDRIYLVIDPGAWALPPPTDNESPERAEWRRRFTNTRREHAAQLWDLARRAVRQAHPSLAYELVLETLRLDADHEAARKLLGYQRFQDAWHTAYEVKMLRAKRVWHAQFGWLPPGAAPRYDQGERFFNNRWLPADDEARVRRETGNDWVVESEHYRIRTDHSLEAAVALGQKLERLYHVWQQLFARYYATQDQLAKLFEGRAPQKANSKRFEVTCFREREDYQKQLARRITADIGITTGIYLADDRRAYFFADAEADDSTLYHEATHQLFGETRPVIPLPGESANFWVIEGIACYLESLAEHDGFITLGGHDAVRFRDARFRLAESRFYMPLAEVAKLGMLALQHDPRIAKLYSQSAGVTHFLMHAEEGRYRDPLVAYIQTVYTGRDTPETLADVLGMPFEEIDTRYQAFMSAAEKQPSADAPEASP